MYNLLGNTKTRFLQVQNTTIPTASEILKILWIRSNRGFFVRVARDLEVDPRTVQQVYWGVSTSRRITEALKKRWAPVEVGG